MIEGILIGFILGLLCCGSRVVLARRQGYQPEPPDAPPSGSPPPPPPRPRRCVIDYEGIRFDMPVK